MRQVFLIVSILCLIFLIEVSAVPLPPLDKYDITGTISEIKWYPQKTIKGIPKMSGSAGYDRIMPAHFIIKLTNYEGIDSENALRITKYINNEAFKDNDKPEKPPFILLKINYKKPNYLKKGMKIKVIGYTVRGDEGGTYTYYDNIVIY